MEEEKPQTLAEKIDKLIELNQKQIEEGSVKKWKLPFKARVGKRSAKRGFATFLVVKDNRNVDFIRLPIAEGTALLEGMPRAATSDYTLHYKGQPFYILPAWSLKPFSPTENYSETERDKMNVAGRRLVLSKLQSEQIAKKGGSWGWGAWIILGIIVLVAGWYLLKGGKLF
jgi:hypothetical protein